MADRRGHVYVTALWRISSFDDLEGIGGERSSGRWHTASPDKRILYASEHPALALIEVLVNLQAATQFIPATYQLIKIAISGPVSTRILPPESLSPEWRNKKTETRFLGDAWLAESRTALLGVPSAPCPESTNYLLNPLHPDVKQLRVEWSRWIEYDNRFFNTRPHST